MEKKAILMNDEIRLKVVEIPFQQNYELTKKFTKDNEFTATTMVLNTNRNVLSKITKTFFKKGK